MMGALKIFGAHYKFLLIWPLNDHIIESMGQKLRTTMTEQPRSQQFDQHIHLGNDGLPEESGLVPGPYLPVPLKSARISDIHTRSDLIRELVKQIPTNEYDLPQYYYRPDMIDKDILLSSMERRDVQFVDEVLQSAIVHVSYDQGFPTFPNGTPVWGQMPWESKESYDFFTAYLMLEGIRRVDSVNHVALDVVHECFNLNYWLSRAKSFDLFKAAHHARLREHRIMNLEDTHWVEGEKLVRRLFQAVGSKSDQDLKDMDVDKLISSIERAVRIQRAAVGLGMQGKDQGETPKATSVEIAMRSVSTFERKDATDSEFDITLLENPELLAEAQSLIIKVNK